MMVTFAVDNDHARGALSISKQGIGGYAHRRRTIFLIFSTISGLARIVISPSSSLFDIAASTRRIILSDLVLGILYVPFLYSRIQ
jgi:hypothetical protein